MTQTPAEKQEQAAAMAKLSRQNRRLRRFTYAVLIALAGGLGASSIWRVEPLLSANDRSRWATVRALFENDSDVVENRYQIDAVIADDREHWDTIDKVKHEGHFYSTKPPLLPTLVEGVYEVVNRITDELDGEPDDPRRESQHNGWKLGEETAITTRAILTIVNLVPWLIALAVVAMIAERYSRRDLTRVLIVATAALGTILSTFLVTLNNHIIGAVSLIFALYPAMRIVIDGERKWWLFALAGFFAAFTCTNELPAALFGVAMFGLLAWKAPKQTLLVFVPFALIPLAGFFYTNWLATGGWKPFYAYYGTEKYEYIHKGVPSYWMNPGGIDANRESPAVYFLHCTIGHHGIFSLTPMFLLAVVGWCGMRWWKNRKLQPFLWMGLGLTLAVVGFYLSRTENYNYGGNTAGLRWTFWLIPFWLVAMIPVLDQLTRAVWFRVLTVLMLLVSVFSATWSLDNPWRPPWLFSLLQRYEAIPDYRTPPEKPPFERNITTWFSTLPKSKEKDADYWIRFEGTGVNGERTTIELRDGGVHTEEGTALRIVEVTKPGPGGKPVTVKYYIDPKAFGDGKTVHGFLWGAIEEDREKAVSFLRGIPTRLKDDRYRTYSVGKVEYLFNPRLREDAFKCYQSSSRARFASPGGKTRHWHRCDAWLCEAVPFGVLRVKYTVNDGETGELISTSVWKAVAVGKEFENKSD